MRRLPLYNQYSFENGRFQMRAISPATAGLTVPSRNLRFPDGHPDNDTPIIIREGFINVNASGLVRESSSVYLLENKVFFLTGWGNQDMFPWRKGRLKGKMNVCSGQSVSSPGECYWPCSQSLHVDYHCQSSYILGQPGSIQSNCPFSLQYYRSSSTSNKTTSTPVFWRY